MAVGVVHIDFETRSAADLKVCGADVYSKHASTDCWCLAYAIDDGDVELWKLGDPPPIDLFMAIAGGATVIGHNVNFELALWNNCAVPKYGWPPLDPAQCECTMAMAYAMAIPASLEKSAAALGISHQKDMTGNRVMMQLARPRRIEEDGTVVWWEATDKLERLYEYCKQDVRVERELHTRLIPLSKKEKELWLLDHHINQRGIACDVKSAYRAASIVKQEQVRLDDEMRRVTEGAVSTCTAVGQLTSWIAAQGVSLDGVTKADVVELLSLPSLPGRIREALRLRQEAGKASTAKLKAMLDRASTDGRIRGGFQYHGAATGRWAGRGVQLQNLPRSSISQEQVDEIFQNLNSDYLTMFYPSVIGVVSEVLRGFLYAEDGKELLSCDFSSIEARVLAWLAGEEKVLNVFRTTGKIYEHAAAGIYGVAIDAVTKDQRMIGKVSVLALGYGGGVGAFQSMAKAYGLKIPDTQAESIKVAWRISNPAIVRYWRNLEHAAIEAVNSPGKKKTAGVDGREVCYIKKGSFLWCLLPSGRVLCYPYPELGPVELPWGETKIGLTYMAEDPISKKWERQKLYGGLLAENVTQAVSRDILAEAMLRLDKRGFPIVAHVHDEIICELPTGQRTIEEMEKIMCELPSWADGLPISAEGWAGRRYRK